MKTGFTIITSLFIINTISKDLNFNIESCKFNPSTYDNLF